MFSGMTFNFPIDDVFEFATNNLNLIMPVLIAVLAVLFFGLFMDQIVGVIMRIYEHIAMRRKLAQEGEDNDGDG